MARRTVDSIYRRMQYATFSIPFAIFNVYKMVAFQLTWSILYLDSSWWIVLKIYPFVPLHVYVPLIEGEVPLLPDFKCRQNYNSPHGWLAFARLLRKELISVRAPSSHSFSSIACCSTSLKSKSSWTQTFNKWAWNNNKIKIKVELDLGESIL